MNSGKYYIVFNIRDAAGQIEKRRVKGWFVVREGRIAQSEGMAKKMLPVGPINQAIRARMAHTLDNGYYEVVADGSVPEEQLEKADNAAVRKIKQEAGTEKVHGAPEQVLYSKHPLKDFKIDAGQHMVPGWEGHNADLVHGIYPYRPAKIVDENTLTGGIRVAGKDPADFRALIKPALDLDEIKDWAEEAKEPSMLFHANDGEPRTKTGAPIVSHRHQHFLNPDFTTAHREAAYQRAASFFGLGHFIPRVALYEDPSGVHSAHEYVHGTTPWKSIDDKLSVAPNRQIQQRRSITPEKVEFLNNNVGKSTLQKLAMMNIILGNHDRHGGNILFDANKNMHLIDHGLSFDYGNATEHVPHYIRHALHDTVEPETHQWLDRLDPAKFHQKLAEMKVPLDLADKAAYRLAEAKLWSEHARKYQPKGPLERPYGFYHLDHALHAMRMHRFGMNKEQRQKEREKIYQGEGGLEPQSARLKFR